MKQRLTIDVNVTCNEFSGSFSYSVRFLFAFFSFLSFWRLVFF